MSSWIAVHAAGLRLAAFTAVLLGLLALETWRPRRQGDRGRALRWPANFALAALDTAILASLPLAAIGAALRAEAGGYGLLHWLQVPDLLAIPLAWLALDVALYAQHRALHEWRWLWPLHRVHHSDIEFDATTGVRFHPFEIVLSMLYKVVLVSLLGAPVTAVLAFELALSLFALWSHANLALPPTLDAALRRVIITPETHRVHHSTVRAEHDSNYGSTLMLWDRLFRSYTPQPRAGHAAMPIGLPQWRTPREQGLGALLAQPLRRAGS
jgi:sterol desaturase/sphingolipid hydroxylase (fatty acid hydroxylase superfamily)